MDFTTKLESVDQEIFKLISQEKQRQHDNIELIASENFVSGAVLEAQGSVLTNKYAEGYPGKRFYNGCEYVDEIESIAIERVKKLFGCDFANVQPHSGSQANQAVFLALLKPGDTILGMSLDSGGHLTHGAAPNLSGKWFNSVSYNVDPSTYLIDYENVRQLALEHRPKIIICGYSAYPRIFDFKKFKDIAEEVGAYLMADIAHIAGLVATGEHPSPFPYADIVTSTTHKTLRGPRGGIILTNNEDIAKKINSAVFPGLQGGPLMHVIAAKAVAFAEALQPEFTTYAKQIVANAKILSEVLIKRGLKITTGGTDCHLMVVDLTPLETLTGKEAEKVLERAGLTCNKNAIPNDPRSPFVTSGLRFGTAAGTTRGFKEKEFAEIGNMISDILEGFVKNGEAGNQAFEQKVKARVAELCKEFPIY